MAGVPKSQWPVVAGWIERANTPPLNITIVERMFCDLYLAERSDTPNRSPRIDMYLRRAGVPESVIKSGKGYWCAAWLGAVWGDAGAEVPPHYASCDSWATWGKKHGLWSMTPVLGAAALYGIPGDASLIGGVIRIPIKNYPYLLDIEGNTSLNGYSSNGLLCDGKVVNQQRLLGYVHPKAAA
jgi:hypothetical protein